MNAQDQIKLLDAGFTLIKPMNYPRPGDKSTRFEIHQKTPERRQWHENGWNYSSPEVRDKIIRNKQKNPKVILIDRRDEEEIITDFLAWTRVRVDATVGGMVSCRLRATDLSKCRELHAGGDASN